MVSVSLMMSDEIAALVTRKAQKMEVTRHKLIMDLVRACVSDEKELEQDSWPTVERAMICPDCSLHGSHCGHAFTEIHVDVRKQTRIRWLCRCSQCAPEVTA